MKYSQILGLLAVAAAALMAFAASASATTVTSPTGTAFTGTIHAESEEDKEVKPGTKHVLLHNSIAKIECESTVSFAVETGNGAGTTPHGTIHEIKFTNCTNGWVVHVNLTGTLEVHYDHGGTGVYNGILTSSGATVTATRLGLECKYQTNATQIGTLTGGSPATLKISAAIPKHGGSALCGGSTANWTGSYVTTSAYYIDTN